MAGRARERNLQVLGARDGVDLDGTRGCRAELQGNFRDRAADVLRSFDFEARYAYAGRYDVGAGTQAG